MHNDLWNIHPWCPWFPLHVKETLLTFFFFNQLIFQLKIRCTTQNGTGSMFIGIGHRADCDAQDCVCGLLFSVTFGFSNPNHHYVVLVVQL